MDFNEPVFFECSIQKKLKFKEVIIRIVSVLVAVLVFAVSYFFRLAPLGIIVCVWFEWLFLTSRKIEWEYSLKGRVLDIYKIINRSRRRKMIPLELDRIEKFGKYNDDSFKHYERQKIRILDFTSLDSTNIENWYYIVANRPKGKFLVVIEPTEEILQQMMLYIPKFM